MSFNHVDELRIQVMDRSNAHDPRKKHANGNSDRFQRFFEQREISCFADHKRFNVYNLLGINKIIVIFRASKRTYLAASWLITYPHVNGSFRIIRRLPAT